MRPYLYRLEGHTPVPCGSDDDRRRADGGIGTRVAYTCFRDKHFVSTVFLAIDHNFGDGPPILFETMVFGGLFDGAQERYPTWDEAVSGHATMVAKVITYENQLSQTMGEGDVHASNHVGGSGASNDGVRLVDAEHNDQDERRDRRS